MCVSHGGDILGDIDAILYVEKHGLPYVAEYKEDFPKAYGIEFDEALDKLPSFPQKEVIEAFNILASVRELYTWKALRVQIKRRRIEQLAIEITKEAMETDINQLPERFEKGGDLAEKFSEMLRLFMVIE